jgi:hypothetical protein
LKNLTCSAIFLLSRATAIIIFMTLKGEDLIHETSIRNSLTDLGCATETLAVISGYSNTRLSRAFRGLQDFSGQEIETLLDLIRDLKGLVQDAAPYPVSFKNPAIIKSLVECRRAGQRWIPICIGPVQEVSETELAITH